MSKHTAGPWFKLGPGDRDAFIASDADHRTLICQMCSNSGQPVVENARLIASAPDLLASLQELSEWMRTHTGFKDGTHEMLCRAADVIVAAGSELR